ncbi:hypothetical protein B0H14DRAFT_3170954 [Mycena olivaceomarginata]|nr:hypothetical protein B0H14DRAFT_3170954 [Mycena olivaceomarginata]
MAKPALGFFDDEEQRREIFQLLPELIGCKVEKKPSAGSRTTEVKFAESGFGAMGITITRGSDVTRIMTSRALVSDIPAQWLLVSKVPDSMGTMSILPDVPPHSSFCCLTRKHTRCAARLEGASVVGSLLDGVRCAAAGRLGRRDLQIFVKSLNRHQARRLSPARHHVNAKMLPPSGTDLKQPQMTLSYSDTGTLKPNEDLLTVNHEGLRWIKAQVLETQGPLYFFKIPSFHFLNLEAIVKICFRQSKELPRPESTWSPRVPGSTRRLRGHEANEI